MWEAIASNRRRSWLLIGLLGGLLVALGGVIGLALEPQTGGPVGVAVALGLWLLLWGLAVGAGERILLSSARAREIRKEDAPQLWNVVEEMTIAAGLGRMPRIYIVDDPAPNAFAVGRRPEQAAVAVTSGLLKRLTRDELQGVVAHELGHIRNLDVRFMTLAAVMVGAVVLLARGFLRGMFYGGGRRRSSRGGGQAQALLLLVAIVLAILAPLAAQLLYFACSRRREYLADASAAQFTRYPEGLASALEKIARAAGGAADVNRVVAPMYIVNPLQEHAAFSLFSTHPKTADRIRILRSMAGAGLAAYEEAYRRVHGGRKSCIGRRSLADAADAAIRPPSPEPATRAQAVARAQAAGELLDRVLGMVVVPCLCGVRLKLPADAARAAIRCPRCGRTHAVPRAEPRPAEPGAGPRGGPAAPLRYRRRGTGWEAFQCGACGHTVQIGPTFAADSVCCPKCHRRIEVLPAGT